MKSSLSSLQERLARMRKDSPDPTVAYGQRIISINDLEANNLWQQLNASPHNLFWSAFGVVRFSVAIPSLP